MAFLDDRNSITLSRASQYLWTYYPSSQIIIYRCQLLLSEPLNSSLESSSKEWSKLWKEGSDSNCFTAGPGKEVEQRQTNARNRTLHCPVTVTTTHTVKTVRQATYRYFASFLNGNLKKNVERNNDKQTTRD